MNNEIKKIKLRFVLTVIIIVFVMMSLIAGVVIQLVTRSMYDSVDEMLETIISEPVLFPRIQRDNDDIQLPYIVLDVDADFAIIKSYGGYYSADDMLDIQAALGKALSAEDALGTLEEYHLRYIREYKYPGLCTVAFADVSSVEITRHHVTVITCLIALAALVVFTILAFVLSSWVTSPVEAAWQQQKQFISDASHELKTPITVITTNAELLQMEDCSDEDKQKYISNVLTVSHQMKGLVEELLNLARIEKIDKLTFESFDISKAYTDEVMLYEPVMYELGLNLVSDINDGLQVKANKQRLIQLLTILLDNASKYSLKGDVTVRLNQSGRNVIIEVENPSNPLSDEELKNIFKRFYRADESHNLKGSFGLGLSIAQGICEAHSGSISAIYSDGKIVFKGVLPIA